MGPSASEPAPAALLRLMRRRVPPEKRQRTEMSCDWCKKKRCKCLRSASGDTCRACSEIGRPCTTTEPRKRRVYGSLSSPSGPLGQQAHIPPATTAPQASSTASVSSSSTSSPHSPPQGPSMNFDSGIHNMNIDMSTTDPRLLLLHPEPQRHQQQQQHQHRLPAPRQQMTVAPRDVETTSLDALVVAQKKMPPPALPPQQKRLCDERLFEDALGFPRYIGPLGSYTLLVKLWETMAVWSAPMALRDSAQTMSQNQPVLRIGDVDGDDGRRIELPPREVADVLVALFFDKVHCDFPIFHRALFQASYENMWAPLSPSPPHGGPRANQHRHHHENPMNPDTEPAWLMCLSMVFVLGLEAASSQSSAIRRLVGNTARREALKARYLAKAKEVLPDVISGSMLVHVQALMLYCRYLHITRNRNACWNLTGAAIRVAVAIGLHRNGVHGKCSPLERELRRRIWWTLYAFERIECSSLGRTSAIDDAECNVGVPTEGLLDMSDIIPLGYVEVHAELMTILGSICKHQYGGSNSSGGGGASASSTGGVDVPRDQIDFAMASSAALDQWHAQLPGHIRLNADSPNTHQRAILLLHVQHHYTVTLLCRPFLLALVAKNKPGPKGAPSSSSKKRQQKRDTMAIDAIETANDAPASSSDMLMFARKCIDAAKAAVAVIDRLFRAGLFNSKTWWDVYFIEATCMVLALGRFVNDKDLRNDVGILDALRTCIHILKECKEFSPTMHRFAVVTQDFAQALVAEVPKEPGEEAPPRQAQSQTIDHQVSSQLQPDERRGQQSQQQVNCHQNEQRQAQQHQHGQHQFLGHPPHQPFLNPSVTNMNSFSTTHTVRDVDDLGGDPGSNSTAGSQSGSSPDESFIPAIPGLISGAHHMTGGSMLPDPFSMPWNLADISQLWGDFVEPPEHWWQQGLA
ncbi:hypothetical protein Sste5344_000042 [Sporothrix stenoceras]